jgi:hypothetical protein
MMNSVAIRKVMVCEFGQEPQSRQFEDSNRPFEGRSHALLISIQSKKNGGRKP